MSSGAETIHVTRWGATGPEILMIHGGVQGGPSDGPHSFAHQEPLADHGWQVVVPDRPGHGKSPSRGPEDMEVDAVWVAEMFGQGVHLVGHSYGGCIAVAAAALRPEAVRSLTLIEAPLLKLALDDPAVQKFAFSLGAAMMQEGTAQERIGRLFEATGIPESEGSSPTAEQFEAMNEALKVMRSPIDWDSVGAFQKVIDAEIPVLAVSGGWSPGFEVVLDKIAELSGGERVVIETGHHFPQWDPGFNDALESFLAGVEARDATST